MHAVNLWVLKMTGGPKRGQPWPPSSPVKPFWDDASKFGAL